MDELTKDILNRDTNLRVIHSKIEKIENWDLLCKNPLVTICMATYNHENFIKGALDGILTQKTDFEYEIIIKEDFSADKTRDIIYEYQKKYPDKIRLWLCKENLYSQNLKPRLDLFARGKYIARCEGDDYWIEPSKLQAQVNFLEENSEYSGSFHNAYLKHDGKELVPFSNVEDREYVGSEILDKWIVPTASILFKKAVYDNYIYSDKFLYGDIILLLNIAEKGKLFGHNFFGSVYRRHRGGISFSMSIPNRRKFIIHHIEIMKRFPKYKTVQSRRIKKMYIYVLAKELQALDYRFIYTLINLITFILIKK